MCVFQLAAAAEVTIRKRQRNWDDEGRENEGREVEGVGINLGGLRNNWEKKNFRNLPLIMFVENGFRNSHYYCLMKYITMVMNPGIVESVFVLREHFIRTEHITIVDKVNPFQ